MFILILGVLYCLGYIIYIYTGTMFYFPTAAGLDTQVESNIILATQDFNQRKGGY